MITSDEPVRSQLNAPFEEHTEAFYETNEFFNNLFQKNFKLDGHVFETPYVQVAVIPGEAKTRNPGDCQRLWIALKLHFVPGFRRNDRKDLNIKYNKYSQIVLL